MENTDPKTFNDRLALVVQYQLATVRGLALAGDHGGALDRLRFHLFPALAALGSAVNSDDVFTMLPDLRAKWEAEAVAYITLAFPKLPPDWDAGVKTAAPADVARIHHGHALVTFANLKTQVHVEALNVALDYLALENPLLKRFEFVLRVLLAAPPVVRLEPREVAATGNGNGH